MVVAPPVALNLTVPLLCIKVALVNAAFPSISRTAEVEVKAVPAKVKFPPIVIFAEPPVKIPEEKEALLTVENVFAPCEIVPVYPFTVIFKTLTGTSIAQFHRCAALLNVTASAAPGTLAPPAPPETVDQLAVLFQFEGAAATQKRLAAAAS